MTTERRVPIFYNCPSSGPNNNVREENTTNSSLIIEQEEEDIINNDISQNSNNSDQDSTSSSSDQSRKPSYVGLSCAVSGYNSYIRYTSPSRKNSPPQQFRVPEPQILDFNNLDSNGRALDNMRQEDMNTVVGAPVRGQIDHPGHCAQPEFYHHHTSHSTRKVVQSGNGMTTVETVTKFYQNNNNNNNGSLNGGGGTSMRETSPGGSDTSSVGSGSAGSSGNGGGNLVQRQIERLYGGKMQTVRLTSPEPRSDDSSSPEWISGTGNNLHRNNGTSGGDPLELKTLKVPAVFRLLRPEFREQLKNNSCQVTMPTDNNSATIGFKTIPIQRPSPERIIPVTTLNSGIGGQNGSGDNNLRKTERIIPVTRSNEPFKGRTSSQDTTDNFAGRKKTDITSTPVTSRIKATTTTAAPVSPTSGEKPALPAKPLSPPTRNARSPVAAPRTPKNDTDLNRNNNNNNGHHHDIAEFSSPALVSSVEPKKKIRENGGGILPGSNKTVATPATENGSSSPAAGVVKSPEKIVPSELKSPEKIRENDADDLFPEPEDLEIDDEEEELDQYPCGIRERSLLCPIQEEDTESTASGSSVSVKNIPEKIRENENSSVKKAVMNTEESNESSNVILEEIHDGHYFIRILENEIFKFEEQICDFEEDLGNDAISDDVRESIFAAIGKAKLLMSQKLTQFRGLCDKNINSNPEEDPFVPTSEDLAGFWDMVYIQVEHIHSLFAELSTLRQNGWKRPELKKITKPEPAQKSTKPKGKKGTSPSTSATKSPKSEAAKARDEARRKMLEEKKRLMKLKQQQQQQNSDNDSTFVQF